MVQQHLIKPFGTYSPNVWRKLILTFTQSIPNLWLPKRIAFLLRRLALLGQYIPYDVTRWGLSLRLYPHQNLCEKRILFTPQLFDVVERKILAKTLPKDAVFLDIGANIGAYTLFVSTLVDSSAKLYAFEPQPIVYERLLYNLSQNPTSMVKALACAVADKEGDMTLFMNNSNKGEASVVLLGHNDIADVQTFAVPCKTLLGFINEENLSRIDGIKLDVEGAEDLILMPFLRDAPENLLPKLIILENAKSRWASDLLGALQEKGYTLIAETRMNLLYTIKNKIL